MPQLKKIISELSSLWNIHPTPNDTHGVQQSLKETPYGTIGKLKATDEGAKFMTDKHVMSGDGTRIGKRLHVVIFTFPILEEEKFAHQLEITF